MIWGMVLIRYHMSAPLGLKETVSSLKASLILVLPSPLTSPPTYGWGQLQSGHASTALSRSASTSLRPFARLRASKLRACFDFAQHKSAQHERGLRTRANAYSFSEWLVLEKRNW